MFISGFASASPSDRNRRHYCRSNKLNGSLIAVIRSLHRLRSRLTGSGTLLTVAAATGTFGYAETGHPCRRARGEKVAVDVAAAKVPMIWIQRRLPAKFDRLGATMKNAAMLNAAGMEIAFPPTIFLMKSDAEAAL